MDSALFYYVEHDIIIKCNSSRILQDVWTSYLSATTVDKLPNCVHGIGHFKSFHPRIVANTTRVRQSDLMQEKKWRKHKRVTGDS